MPVALLVAVGVVGFVVFGPLSSPGLDTSPAPVVDGPVPAGLVELDRTTWSSGDSNDRWALSWVFRAEDGRALILTADSALRRTFDGDEHIGDDPARTSAGPDGGFATLEWDARGYGFTLLGHGLAVAELRTVAERLEYDWIGVGATVVPRVTAVPNGLELVRQAAGGATELGPGADGSTVVYRTSAGFTVELDRGNDLVPPAADLEQLPLQILDLRGTAAVVMESTGPGGALVRRLVWEGSDGATRRLAGIGVPLDELVAAALLLPGDQLAR
jgi:hypothetical protein